MCKIEKPADEFTRDRRVKCGLTAKCKPCNNKYQKNRVANLPTDALEHHREVTRAQGRKYYKKVAQTRSHGWLSGRQLTARKCKLKQYGLDISDYEAMFVAQNERCAICLRHASELKTFMHVDHNHKTGRTRGLLCTYCNIGIGRFADDPDRMERARDYLRRYQDVADAN